MKRLQSPRRGLALWALASFGALACTMAWAGTLQGTATYRERIALPPDAVFEALLQDITRADAPAVVLGRARVEPAGQPPFRFGIDYDDAAVRPDRRYTVSAGVTHQGRVLFTTDRIYPVLDGRGAPLRLRLISARNAPGTGPATAGSSRPPIDSPLRGTTWKLVRLGDSPVSATERQREAHLVFDEQKPQVAGSGGCNRLSGDFKLDGDRLRFGRLASTMMACPTGMEEEQRFMTSLEKVERYQICGNQLELLDAAGTVIAQFEAEAPH